MRLTEVQGAGKERDLQLVLQVFDCVVPDGEGSYLAAPISTGPRYYEALAAHRAASLDELIRAMGHDRYLQEVRWPNVEEGEAVAGRLRKNGVRYLINTGPIFVREWPGLSYMDLCFALLERKVNAVYMHPEWAFSSGAVQEYFFCYKRNIRLLDTEGQVLTPTRALDALELVQSRLSDLGISTEQVEQQIDRLRDSN